MLLAAHNKHSLHNMSTLNMWLLKLKVVLKLHILFLENIEYPRPLLLLIDEFTNRNAR